MAKCKKCNVEILDETEVCPLCKSILQPTDEVENMYPDVRHRARVLTLLCNIYLFLAICLQAFLTVVNFMRGSQIMWCVISGLILLYLYLVLRFAVLGKSGHRSKVTVLVLLAVLSAIAIDMVIGYRGWSVDYVLPAGIVLVDGIILFCMTVTNRKNWQSYIMWQILMVLFSIIPVGLYLAGLENNLYISFAPLTVSLALFLGTVIIGDRRARLELARRFHI